MVHKLFTMRTQAVQLDHHEKQIASHYFLNENYFNSTVVKKFQLSTNTGYYYNLYAIQCTKNTYFAVGTYFDTKLRSKDSSQVDLYFYKTLKVRKFYFFIKKVEK